MRYNEKFKKIFKVLKITKIKMSKDLKIQGNSTISKYMDNIIPNEKIEKRFIKKYKINPAYLYVYNVPIFEEKIVKYTKRTFEESIGNILEEINIDEKTKDLKLTNKYKYLNTTVLFRSDRGDKIPTCYRLRLSLVIAFNVNPNYFYYDNQPMFLPNMQKYPVTFREDEGWEAKRWLIELQNLQNKKKYKDIEILGMEDAKIIEKVNKMKKKINKDILTKRGEVKKREIRINRRFHESFKEIYNSLDLNCKKICTDLNIDRHTYRRWFNGKAQMLPETEKIFFELYDLNPEYFYVYSTGKYNETKKEMIKGKFKRKIRLIFKELRIHGIHKKDIADRLDLPYLKSQIPGEDFEFRRKMVIAYNINPNYFYFENENIFNFEMIKYPEEFREGESWDAKNWLIEVQEIIEEKLISKEELNKYEDKKIISLANEIKKQYQKKIKF